MKQTHRFFNSAHNGWMWGIGAVKSSKLWVGEEMWPIAVTKFKKYVIRWVVLEKLGNCVKNGTNSPLATVDSEERQRQRRAIGTGNRDGHKDSRQQRAKASGKGRQRRAKGDSDGRQERATANGDGRQQQANRDGGQRRAMAMWSGDGHHLQLWAKQWAVATAAWTVMGGLYYRSPIFMYL